MSVKATFTPSMSLNVAFTDLGPTANPGELANGLIAQ
jgi:hypothetical protein